MFPRRAVTSSSAWIGPAGAHTGLHHDLLDNVAVQVVGRKRFRLLPPGSVQRVGGQSPRYDQWARLSRLTADEVTEHAAHRAAGGPDVLTVDLGPGDVLHVPAGWWHEVVNLSPGVLLSGFHGFQPAVGLLWMKDPVPDGEVRPPTPLGRSSPRAVWSGTSTRHRSRDRSHRRCSGGLTEGLFSGLGRKYRWTMAERAGHSSPDRIQKFRGKRCGARTACWASRAPVRPRQQNRTPSTTRS